jgi:DNA-binding XRE family transcriptional regulator
MTENIIKARAAWGKNMPGWIATLAKAADSTSQRTVANTLDISSTTISKILANKYPGNMAEMAERVTSVFEATSVDCPAFGEIPTTSCRRNRARPGPALGFHHMRFAAFCPTCIHNPKRNPFDEKETSYDL